MAKVKAKTEEESVKKTREVEEQHAIQSRPHSSLALSTGGSRGISMT